METEILVICDNAQNYQDKMVVVGPFNTIHAVSCPFTHPTFSLAVRLNYNSKDKHGKKDIKIEFIDEKGAVFIPQINSSAIIPENIDESHTISIVVGLNNVKFDSFGKYTIKITIDDFYKETYLYIKKRLP
ncbi:hypothetical protein AGMMS49525_02120 [Bacteroidia bacterium]|nr:hypothetical protein AGMMS49525_02120 [Bacteroidia bacterium]